MSLLTGIVSMYGMNSTLGVLKKRKTLAWTGHDLPPLQVQTGIKCMPISRRALRPLPHGFDSKPCRESPFILCTWWVDVAVAFSPIPFLRGAVSTTNGVLPFSSDACCLCHSVKHMEESPNSLK